MAQINFGMLDTSMPERLGAMPGNALAAMRQRRMQDEDRAFAREGAQMQNALARMQLTKGQRDMEADEALRTAAAGGGEWSDVVERVRKVDPMRALDIEGKVGAVQSSKAAARGAVTKQAWDKLEQYRKIGLENVRSPRDYAAWLHQQHTDPDLAPVMGMLPPLEESLRTIPRDPQEFEQFRQQGMLGMQKWLEMNKPTEFERNMKLAGLSPEEQQAAARARVTKETTHAPAASITNYGQPVSAVDPATGKPVLVQFDKSGQAKVAPFAPYNAQAAEAQGKKERGAQSAIQLLDEADKWIDTATGSFAGAARDQAGRLVGLSSEASQAASRLSALQGALMMAQPRMEGPQSNLDVALYERMAGRIGDPTVPAPEKRAAMDTIRTLHQKYVSGAQEQGQQQERQPQAFNSMPDPSQYSGRVMRDAETGIRYRSNGSRWVRE